MKLGLSTEPKKVDFAVLRVGAVNSLQPFFFHWAGLVGSGYRVEPGNLGAFSVRHAVAM